MSAKGTRGRTAPLTATSTGHLHRRRWSLLAEGCWANSRSGPNTRAGHQYTERAVLLNVDCEDADEIIVLNEIWEPDTCVECSKGYRIDIWTMAEGEFARDPAWNGGQPLETASQFSLLDPMGCDLADLMRLVPACPTKEP